MSRACLFQGTRAGRQGRARRQDIIHQQDTLVVHMGCSAVRDFECPRHIATASLRAEPTLNGRAAAAFQDIDAAGQAGTAGDTLCQPGLLVEASTDKARIVQRHGHDQIGFGDQLPPRPVHPAGHDMQPVPAA